MNYSSSQIPKRIYKLVNELEFTKKEIKLMGYEKVIHLFRMSGEGAIHLDLLYEGGFMQIIPITYKEASAYVNANHRHHSASQGCKFCIGLQKDSELIGVAMCGRPVSRMLDDGFTLEINRVCTDGTKNACSMLYGACVRIAKNMGYKKVITYILESEDGASVKASNFKYDGIAGGTHWTGVRNKGQNIPGEMKQRYIKMI